MKAHISSVTCQLQISTHFRLTSSTMHKLIFAYACLAQMVRSRRVQYHSQPFADQKAIDRANPLAKILFAFNPTRAVPSTFVAPSHRGLAGKLALASYASFAFQTGSQIRHYVDGEPQEKKITMMANEPSAIQKLAQQCSEEGCPINDVEEILLQLKMEGNVAGNVALTTEIEQLLSDVKSKQMDVHKVMEDLTWGSPVPTSSKIEFEQTGVKFWTPIANVPTQEIEAGDCNGDYYYLDEGCPIMEIEDLMTEMRDYPALAPTVAKLEIAVTARKKSEDVLQDAIASLSPR